MPKSEKELIKDTINQAAIQIVKLQSKIRRLERKLFEMGTTYETSESE